MNISTRAQKTQFQIPFGAKTKGDELPQEVFQKDFFQEGTWQSQSGDQFQNIDDMGTWVQDLPREGGVRVRFQGQVDDKSKPKSPSTKRKERIWKSLEAGAVIGILGAPLFGLAVALPYVFGVASLPGLLGIGALAAGLSLPAVAAKHIPIKDFEQKPQAVEGLLSNCGSTMIFQADHSKKLVELPKPVPEIDINPI